MHFKRVLAELARHPRRWWGIVALPIIVRLFEHRALEWANHQIDEGAVVLIPSIKTWLQIVIDHPLWALFIAAAGYSVFMVLCAHISVWRNRSTLLVAPEGTGALPPSRTPAPLDTTVTEGPLLVMQFPRGIEHIGIEDRDFWIIRNLGPRAATSITIDTAHLGDYRLEFDDINAIGPSGHGADVARVSYMGYRSDSFWGTNRDGFSSPAHALKNALEAASDLTGATLPITIHYKDMGTKKCTRQIIRYEAFVNFVTVSTEACRAGQEPRLEFQQWHAGSSRSFPLTWAGGSPTWVAISNSQAAPARTAVNVTARLEFSNSDLSKRFGVPQAHWFAIKDRMGVTGAGRLEEWRTDVEIDGGDEQSFVLYVTDDKGSMSVYKNSHEPIGLIDYDHWNVKILVSSDNAEGFEGNLGFTYTRRCLTQDDPLFTKQRNVAPLVTPA